MRYMLAVGSYNVLVDVIRNSNANLVTTKGTATLMHDLGVESSEPIRIMDTGKIDRDGDRIFSVYYGNEYKKSYSGIYCDPATAQGELHNMLRVDESLLLHTMEG